MAKFWHMQLHPNDANWDLEEINKLILHTSVIGMGNEWENDKGAPNRFKNDMSVGDIVIIRHQGSPRFLVEVISNCISNEGENEIDVWFHIYRKIRILSDKGEYFKKTFKTETGKNWASDIYAPSTFEPANDWDFAHFWYNKIIKHENMKQICELLKNNKNLILTGAPGTGKTFLAQQIAAQLILGKEYEEKTATEEEKMKMTEQYDFVQFHPSFDYTDFVEGLRPTEDGKGNVTFRREDGIFIRFCRKALKAYQEAKKTEEEVPKFVFIIDEINRGELSKIFGELFFCIDPGYRGNKGKVKTQYFNLWKNEQDEEQKTFGGSEYFFIPENVYIIGTMNDIDRSVESMDFAMRRRFAWKEIKAKAEDSQSMLDENNAWDNKKPEQSVIEEIKKRMNNLNQCILNIQGFSTAYQIGAAYFLKLKYYIDTERKPTEECWNSLWYNHLEGLLFEYLRGLPNAKEDLEKLHRSYSLKDIYIEKEDGTVVKEETYNE